jgi:hypothetical protein
MWHFILLLLHFFFLKKILGLGDDTSSKGREDFTTFRALTKVITPISLK